MNSNDVLVKCGGFASHLARRIVANIDGDPLWGARFDATDPEAVAMAHYEFLQNGADIILSNTYQSSVEGFMKYLNLSRDESLQLIRKSVQLAKQAAADYKKYREAIESALQPGLPLILASIGPYGAYLHDGSEYTGSYADSISKEELQQWHEPRIQECLAEGVDGLALETIPCQKEAEAVVDLILKKYPEAKFWVSFQCKDESSLAHGGKFAEAALSIWNMVKNANAVDRLYAIGVNCVSPKLVSPLFKSLKTAGGTDIPLIVYSNSGERYDTSLSKWNSREKPLAIESFVPEWIDLGAKIIGGCCRVYPEDILKIRECVDKLRRDVALKKIE